MKQKYIEIEKELISKYKILIIENSSCRSRMHAHCDGSRRICKWSPSNSIVSLFELAHEIGHIMNGDLENNERSFLEKEYMADKYAKENGFKIKCSAWKLAWWEAYSLIPNVNYVNKIRNNIIRCIIFIKHFISYLFK